MPNLNITGLNPSQNMRICPLSAFPWNASGLPCPRSPTEQQYTKFTLKKMGVTDTDDSSLQHHLWQHTGQTTRHGCEQWTQNPPQDECATYTAGQKIGTSQSLPRAINVSHSQKYTTFQKSILI
jgi:hypothetical protein